MALSPAQNLTRFDKLINPDGTPTDLFMRLLQSSNLLTNEAQAQIDALTGFTINTTAPIAGGPKVLGTDPNITLSHADSGVTAGAKGTATKVAVVTVDAKGHVTVLAETAIDFTVEVEDEGGSLGIFQKLNFAGAGVTATDAGGGVALVTIPGGGGGGSVLGAPWTVPTLAAFTQFNVAPDVMTDTPAGINVNTPNGGHPFALSGAYKAAPGGTYSIYMRVKHILIGPATNSRYGGFVLRNSANGRFLSFNFFTNGYQFGFNYNRWDNAFAYNAGFGAGLTMAFPPEWLKIDIGAAGVTGFWFGDGYNWSSIGLTELWASWLGATPTEIGFGGNNALQTMYVVNSFDTTAPAAGGGGEQG